MGRYTKKRINSLKNIVNDILRGKKPTFVKTEIDTGKITDDAAKAFSVTTLIHKFLELLKDWSDENM